MIDSFSIHIIGLGLMGGSLAMALRGKGQRLTAEDINPAVLHQATASGVIDGIGEAHDADIVVLAVPADIIPDQLPTLDLKPGTLVIDLGSTKTRICNALDDLPEGVLAVGGHPMCGLAENGYANATGKLYQGARFVLCETDRTTSEARTRAEALVQACGAEPLWMERERHDHLTALASHLPHLLSFALMSLAMEEAAQDAALFELAAGGFDGATRLARTDAAMIVGMFGTNADELRAVTESLRDHLDRLEQLLDDLPRLYDELDVIVAARRSYTAQYGERLIT
ncbi:MAG: prephenate dehydrogenase/arogenate dehydrogenase family protein [Chloroflexi bacterium]|nr:prephenate dehydrogenase/arogenate dehydrogenase family protein [Chloroflexota bacterium]